MVFQIRRHLGKLSSAAIIAMGQWRTVDSPLPKLQSIYRPFHYSNRPQKRKIHLQMYYYSAAYEPFQSVTFLSFFVLMLLLGSCNLQILTSTGLVLCGWFGRMGLSLRKGQMDMECSRPGMWSRFEERGWVVSFACCYCWGHSQIVSILCFFTVALYLVLVLISCK